MLTGLTFVLIGVLILRYPMMAAAWQLRRMRKTSTSPFVNWIIRW